MKADFVNPFLLSCSTCSPPWRSWSSNLRPGATDELAREIVPGLIGMVGPQTRGSLSISFEKGLALRSRVHVGRRRPPQREGWTDMAGEITNMVTGGAKRMLGEKGCELTWRPHHRSRPQITPLPGRRRQDHDAVRF